MTDYYFLYFYSSPGFFLGQTQLKVLNKSNKSLFKCSRLL
jgi:hypothetical protein